MKGFNIIITATFLLVAVSAAGEISDVKMDELKKSPPPALGFGRDPFERWGEAVREKESTGAEEEFITFKINGIISDGKKAVAIINGEFLRKGDEIAGYRILDIAGDRVLLEREGRKIYLGVDRFTLSLRKKGAR